MPQAMWNGYLSFGLVSVPVALYVASEDRSIHFNQLRKGTSHRVRYRKVDEVTGEELSSDDIVKGVPTGADGYVVIEDEELKKLAPGRSELIEISDFVDLDEIDPVFFQKSYYLSPRTKAAEKAYQLLREAMRRQGKVGIATFVMRDKQYLVAVRPNARAMTLETLFFADEIRPVESVLPAVGEVAELSERELEIAEQLIVSLSSRWEPDRYEDDYRGRVMALVEAKKQGRELVGAESEPHSNVVDLVAALEASLARVRRTRSPGPAEAGGDASAPTTAGVVTGRSRSQRRRSVQSPPAEQQSFEGMSRAELLALAAERDVQGRAKMTKLELVQALKAPNVPVKSTVTA